MSIPITNIKLNKNTEFQAVFQEYVFFKFLNIFYCISYNTLFIPQISQEAEFIFLFILVPNNNNGKYYNKEP